MGWDILKEIEDTRESIEIFEDALENVGHHDHDMLRELNDERYRLNMLLREMKRQEEFWVHYNRRK